MYFGGGVFVMFVVKVVRVSWLEMSVKAFTKPPVLPIGAWNIETSAQLFDNIAVPVHKHLPFMHAPFLLQW